MAVSERYFAPMLRVFFFSDFSLISASGRRRCSYELKMQYKVDVVEDADLFFWRQRWNLERCYSALFPSLRCTQLERVAK